MTARHTLSLLRDRLAAETDDDGRAAPFDRGGRRTDARAAGARGSIITQSSPFTVPFSGSVGYTLSAEVDDVFTLAYGVDSQLFRGEIDLLESGAEIDFSLPEGVWITSEKGGVWGDVPAPAVPVGPWVAIGSALGLLGGALRGLREKARDVA